MFKCPRAFVILSRYIIYNMYINVHDELLLKNYVGGLVQQSRFKDYGLIVSLNIYIGVSCMYIYVHESI